MRLVALLAACLLLAFVNKACSGFLAGDSPQVVDWSPPDELLVLFKDNAEAKRLVGSLIAAFKAGGRAPSPGVEGTGVELRRMVGSRAALLRVTDGTPPRLKAEQLLQRPEFQLADPNHAVASQQLTAPLLANETDLYVEDLWGMERTQADIARTAYNGSREALVCVIDSGVKRRHPDLADNLDPLLGFDFVSRPPAEGSPDDRLGHGTHVAGIIAAVGENGQGVSGVNAKARLLACKMLDGKGRGSYAGVVRCLNYCMRRRASVVVAALGGRGRSTVMEHHVRSFCETGGLLVAAAGNEGRDLDHEQEERKGEQPPPPPFLPAGMDADCVLSVAATDESDSLAPFSNRGASSVHLAAPGVGIFSTYIEQAMRIEKPPYYSSTPYQFLAGTSPAAAFVAGAAALLVARSGLQLAGPELRTLLMDTADEVPGLAGQVASGGRLNVWRALQVVDPGIAAEASAGPPAAAPALPPSKPLPKLPPLQQRGQQRLGQGSGQGPAGESAAQGVVCRIAGRGGGGGAVVIMQTPEVSPSAPAACYNFADLKDTGGRIRRLHLILRCRGLRCSAALPGLSLWLWSAPLNVSLPHQHTEFAGGRAAEAACPMDEQCTMPLHVAARVRGKLSGLTACFGGAAPTDEDAQVVELGSITPEDRLEAMRRRR